jgi:O-antigen ligase
MPEDFFTNNPNFVYNWRDETRNGIYRAASIFSSQLSFAEYCAIISPIALYFLTGLKGWDRALGGVAYLACLLGIVLSQSRGGALCLVVATIVFVLAVTFRPLLRREMNFRRGVVLFIVAMTMIVGAGAALNSNRVHKAFLGNGQTASSNAERAAQWQKGLPKIMQRPVLGYGLGQSVTVAGAGDSGQVSIDSYVLSLLCDTGFPGVIAFFSYLLILTFSLLRAYVRTAVDDRRFLAIGAGLSGYVLFRLVLSQFENHTMLFILTAVAFFLLMQHRQARALK